MVSIQKKGLILAVAALFLSLSMAPAITADQKANQPKYAVELTSIAENGQFVKETIVLTEEEVQVLQSRLSWLLDLLKNQVNLDGVLELLLQFLNAENYPILSRIVAQVFDSEMLTKGKLIFSEGWSMSLNPFKKGGVSFMKPIEFWMYQEKSEMLQIPSMTTIIDLNPFETTTVMGNQLGFMFRFKGIYVEIPQQMPQQSFTFFLGLSRFAAAVEMVSISDFTN
jgi:hypothetical protein